MNIHRTVLRISVFTCSATHTVSVEDETQLLHHKIEILLRLMLEMEAIEHLLLIRNSSTPIRKASDPDPRAHSQNNTKQTSSPTPPLYNNVSRSFCIFGVHCLNWKTFAR